MKLEPAMILLATASPAKVVSRVARVTAQFVIEDADKMDD